MQATMPLKACLIKHRDLSVSNKSTPIYLRDFSPEAQRELTRNMDEKIKARIDEGHDLIIGFYCDNDNVAWAWED